MQTLWALARLRVPLPPPYLRRFGAAWDLRSASISRRDAATCSTAMEVLAEVAAEQRPAVKAGPVVASASPDAVRAEAAVGVLVTADIPST